MLAHQREARQYIITVSNATLAISYYVLQFNTTIENYKAIYYTYFSDVAWHQVLRCCMIQNWIVLSEAMETQHATVTRSPAVEKLGYV